MRILEESLNDAAARCSAHRLKRVFNALMYSIPAQQIRRVSEQAELAVWAASLFFLRNCTDNSFLNLTKGNQAVFQQCAVYFTLVSLILLVCHCCEAVAGSTGAELRNASHIHCLTYGEGRCFYLHGPHPFLHKSGIKILLLRVIAIVKLVNIH